MTDTDRARLHDWADTIIANCAYDANTVDALWAAEEVKSLLTALTTARAEGFAAGEQAMREKAAKVTEAYLDQFEEPDSYIISAERVVTDVAAAIRALPLSAPVWGAEQERGAIVKWLRERDSAPGWSFSTAANAIERADHLPKESKDG